MQPAGERGAVTQGGRLPRQLGERALRDILCEVRVAAEQAQRRGVNEAEMAFHQLSEGGFIVLLGVAAQQIGVGVHRDICPMVAAGAQNRTRKCARRG
ncbi:MAG: hypothetical protein WCL04_00450 [Verrucomicrobiota bacterium]